MTVLQNDIIRSSIEWTGINLEQRVNVWHLRYESPPPLADATAVSDIGLFLASFYNGMLPSLTILLKSVRVVNQNLTQALLMPDHIPVPGIDGTGVGSASAPQIAALILGRTLKSRVQRRVYIPGTTEDVITNGVWDAGFLVQLAAAGAQMIGAQLINGSLYRT